MSVTNVHKDTERLTMTVTAEYDVTVERAWALWNDPRQLERWWGPPTYPATVVQHDLAPGGQVTYFMTGPEGDVHHGWWRVLEVDPPARLVVEDGFGDDAGHAAAGMPTTTMTVELAASRSGGVTLTMRSVFPSLEAMEQLVAMGMEEGLQQAMSQIDDVLAAHATS
jgi:uncharacterized protein YndB with AHSA1/START domain